MTRKGENEKIKRARTGVGVFDGRYGYAVGKGERFSFLFKRIFPEAFLGSVLCERGRTSDSKGTIAWELP